MQFEIEPLVLYIRPDSYAFVSVKLSTGNLPDTIAETQQVWQSFVPDTPFEYFFLAENFATQYRLELQISRLLQIFTLIAISIACMGLFALASFMTENRRKEVGIRKVLGASVSEVVFLLTYSFCKPELVAAFIAVPVSWLIANEWLSLFANRIDVSWDIFAIAIVLAFLIAFATVAGQALKSAQSNPIESISIG